MSRNYIVVGDSHSHGGHVTSGAPNSKTGGRPIARLGDAAVCEIHGSTSISKVSGKVMLDGKEAACDGDELACGGRLIATQVNTGRR
jgi:uncharacterized Zn-binding protein involved in type VI secretion